MGIDRKQLAKAVETVRRLYYAVPYWNDTAKLHGKVMTLHQMAQTCDGRDDLAALLENVAALEAGIRQIHERDPLTRLLRHLTELRESLQGRSTTATVSSSSGEIGGWCATA